MSTTISTSKLASILPAVGALVSALGGPDGCDEYEIDATVLRAYKEGRMLRAWDLARPDYAHLRADFDAIVTAAANIEVFAATAAEAARNAPPTKDALRERIAFRRWEEESKGVGVDFGSGRTLELMTDATSQSKLTGLLVIASAQPITVSWKGSDGTFLEITNADVPIMADAVFAHVQNCFAREAALLTELEAAEDTAVFAEVVTKFWPE